MGPDSQILRPTTSNHSLRLESVVAMMRELSQLTDPQAMVRSYSTWVSELMPVQRSVSISRRGLTAPQYRVTRSTQWREVLNPWTQKDQLPLHEGGLAAELIYSDEPRIINDLQVPADDPAAPYLEGMGSLMALPNYDQGTALNMTLLMRRERDGFDPDVLPERVWMSNLFGRGTSQLVLKKELENAYAMVDRELRVVADIQKSLLPETLPEIPRLNLAAHYQTSRWAGGDYYDFFPLSDNRWGILIADVSGHGTPAAVLMAILHAIAHGHPGHPDPPAALLEHVHERLLSRYVGDTGTFVTAFYAVFDPRDGSLECANAGHNPPRLMRCGSHEVISLDEAGGLPLGLFPDQRYNQARLILNPGDQLVLYTDGVTDSADAAGNLFGVDRLDQAIATCRDSADDLIQGVLAAIEQFTGGLPPEDDRTMLVAKVR